MLLIRDEKAYGVFLDYFLAEGLYPDATPFDYALIGGLSVSMALIITPAINTSTRKLGTRPTLSIGLVLFTASLIGASFATEVWQLYLSQGVCIGWGTGFLYVGSANIIPQWFSRRRSLANGICASGAGFGGLIYSLATSALLQRAGPPLTFRVLAACQFVANLVSIILISDRNQTQRPNQSAFNYRLLKQREVWLVLGWGCMSELGYTVLLFSLPNYARSIGLDARQGSVVAALLNLSTFFGRILLGHSSDVLGRINITTITTGFCGTICLVIWIFAKSFGVLCFFAILAGMVCGAFWATIAPVAADVTGLSELPSTLSIVLVLMVIPATCKSLIEVPALRSGCPGPKANMDACSRRMHWSGVEKIDRQHISRHTDFCRPHVHWSFHLHSLPEIVEDWQSEGGGGCRRSKGSWATSQCASAIQTLVPTASQLFWTKQSRLEEAVYPGKGLISKNIESR